MIPFLPQVRFVQPYWRTGPSRGAHTFHKPGWHCTKQNWMTLTKARHWWLMSPCCNQGALTLQPPGQTPVPFCMMWNDLGLYHVLCNHSHFLCRREPLVRRLCCHSKNCRAAGETPPGNRRKGVQWYTPHFDDHWNLYMEHTLSQHSSFHDVTSY